MPKKGKIIIDYNPSNDSIQNYLLEWVKLINEEEKKNKLEQLRTERKEKIKEIFKDI